ncbi:MAG TPA: hypothetical protein VGS57_01240 [Thermoanaerobaculia bacterium]|jgi:hypothetical protein|nr:hypothetical protein [Thermoanaerobaculia bacterium]
MRRFPRVTISIAASVLALLGAAASRAADDSKTALGSFGEVYTVKSGSYGSLFVGDLPPDSANNAVLALDVLKDGKVSRYLVPGTGGPEAESDAVLALDTIGNRVYVVWQANRVFTVAGFGAQGDHLGWQEPVDLAGDPASTKRNPQLATSVVRSEKLDEEGNKLSVSRTFLHLVYAEDGGAAGPRLAYTAAAIEGTSVVPSTQAFDLRGLAGNAPAVADPANAPLSLKQRPVARRGRDGDNVGVAFVDDPRGELVTLELRPIAPDLHYFADKARAVIIETGIHNPGSTIAAIVDKARAVIIETGHRILHPVVADFLSTTFLDNLAAADPALSLDAAVRGAWAHVIGVGIALQQGSTPSVVHVVELAGTELDGSSRALDLRWVSRRGLPPLPDGDVKLFLSSRAQEASIAWSVATAVRYRETQGGGWDPQRSLSLGPTLTREQAFKLVEQRLDDQ